MHVCTSSQNLFSNPSNAPKSAPPHNLIKAITIIALAYVAFDTYRSFQWERTLKAQIQKCHKNEADIEIIDEHIQKLEGWLEMLNFSQDCDIPVNYDTVFPAFQTIPYLPPLLSCEERSELISQTALLQKNASIRDQKIKHLQILKELYDLFAKFHKPNPNLLGCEDPFSRIVYLNLFFANDQYYYLPCTRESLKTERDELIYKLIVIMKKYAPLNPRKNPEEAALENLEKILKPDSQALILPKLCIQADFAQSLYHMSLDDLQSLSNILSKEDLIPLVANQAYSIKNSINKLPSNTDETFKTDLDLFWMNEEHLTLKKLTFIFSQRFYSMIIKTLGEDFRKSFRPAFKTYFPQTSRESLENTNAYINWINFLSSESSPEKTSFSEL